MIKHNGIAVGAHATTEPWRFDQREQSVAILTLGGSLVTFVDNVEIAEHVVTTHNAVISLAVALGANAVPS